MTHFPKSEQVDVSQSMWGFGGLDCLRFPGDPQRAKNALYNVLNMEFEGGALVSRAGYREMLNAYVGDDIVGTTTATFNLAANSDDGQCASGAFTAGGGEVIMGNTVAGSVSTDGFFRWPSVTIPQGYAIVSAYITFKAKISRATGTKLKIYFVDADDPAAPTTEAEYNALTLTSNYVEYEPGAWTQDTSYNTDDITAIIQELVNRPNWESGNAMVAVVQDNGSAAQKEVEAYSYDYAGNNTNSAKLVLTYAPGAEILGFHQLRLGDTSKYNLILARRKLFLEEAGATTELYTLGTLPFRSPAFATYKDRAVICSDGNAPLGYDPTASPSVSPLITSYPSGYSASTFTPDTVCVCQSRLFMGLEKTLFWGPVDSFDDFETSTDADDAGYQPLDCAGRISALIPWHESEVIVLTDYGERFRFILGSGDQTAFYIKQLPPGRGCIKGSAQAVGGNIVYFADRDGIHNLGQEEFAGNIRSLEVSHDIRPIFNGGKGSFYPFRITGTNDPFWRSVVYNARSQYWLAVPSSSRRTNNRIIVVDFSTSPPRITLFQFAHNVSCLESILDSNDREIVVIGTDNGMVYKYGYDHFQDNDRDYTQSFEVLVDFGDSRRVDRLHEAIVHLVETGNFTVTVSVYADFFFESAYEDSTTFSCLSKSSYLGSFTLGTDTLGRRELFHKAISGFSTKAEGRILRVVFEMESGENYMNIVGVDFYGKSSRITGDS